MTGRLRFGRLALAVSLVAVIVGTPSGASSAQPDPRDVAYAIAVNIPEYEGQDPATFACQLCQTATGGKTAADYIITIDMEKRSPTYGQVIDRDPVPEVHAELHHMGINVNATRLAVYDLYQNEANIFDVGTNPRDPKLLKVVDLAAESAELLGTVPGLTDATGAPVKVGYSTPHVSYRMPNGNFLIAMGGVSAPTVPSLDRGAPGGFIELTPDGDVVRAFPDITYENGALTNGMYQGKGVFSVDYDTRLGMMAHADLMASREFLCGGFYIEPNPADFGTQMTLWDLGGPNASNPTVFQTVDFDSPFVTAPAFVRHPVNGMDIVFVSTFTSGLWALHRPTGTKQPFEKTNIYNPSDPGKNGFVHMRLNPTKDVLYLSNPYGDTMPVIDFGDDPLHPEVLQSVAVDEIHMMKFSADGKRLLYSNGLASILSGSPLNGTPFSPDYGLFEANVNKDGTLGTPTMVFDGSTEPALPKGVFVGDFYLRRNPQAPV